MPDLRVREYPVQPRLGRHMVLDPRSLAYTRIYDGQPLHAREWEPKVPVLDQQDLLSQGIDTHALYPDTDTVDALGSCTGNAGTAVLSCLLTKAEAAAAGLDLEDAAAAERYAIGLYADATRADAWHDQQWPTDDCGSSGLAIAKTLRHRGLIHQYGHALNGHQLAVFLQSGPVLMGMPWHEAFFEPPRSGLLDDLTDWQASPVAGGHEVAVIGLVRITVDRTGRLVPRQTLLRVRNSWSASWGDGGDFLMSLAVYQALRDQIDLIQPRIEGDRR
ncbi:MULTISPECIES: hypothetical protein [unclassified Streptomyces]|uniref:hypothetical protein n=1 Tax=unclassified Streptomyces TaxID=2593676 RepID=UPI0034016297